MSSRPATARAGDTLTAAKLTSMPLKGRNFVALTLLVPGAISTDQQPKTLSLLWLKNNLPPSDWDDQHALFDGFDA